MVSTKILKSWKCTSQIFFKLDILGHTHQKSWCAMSQVMLTLGSSFMRSWSYAQKSKMHLFKMSQFFNHDIRQFFYSWLSNNNMRVKICLLKIFSGKVILGNFWPFIFEKPDFLKMRINIFFAEKMPMDWLFTVWSTRFRFFSFHLRAKKRCWAQNLLLLWKKCFRNKKYHQTKKVNVSYLSLYYIF